MIATIWVIITIWVTEGFRIEGIVSSIRIRLFVYNCQKNLKFSPAFHIFFSMPIMANVLIMSVLIMNEDINIASNL